MGKRGRTKGKDVNRERRLRRLFNLSIEDYERILKYQKGVCYICERKPLRLRLAMDHDHVSGLVRGLLCMRCNKGLAYFRDSTESLFRGWQYILSPPACTALGENRFGLLGKAKYKKKMVYGTPGRTGKAA